MPTGEGGTNFWDAVIGIGTGVFGTPVSTQVPPPPPSGPSFFTTPAGIAVIAGGVILAVVLLK